jgi:hypothetical protein
MRGLFAVDRTTPEWDRMWEAVGGDDPVAFCACCGEGWQYMGTEYHPDSDHPRRIPHAGWYHGFHHRHHPRTRQWEHVWIPMSPDCEVPESARVNP